MITTDITIESADEATLPALLSLLAASGLPPEGLSDHLPTALIARDHDQVIGSAALELYGSSALLRSVAVAPAYQGQGLGQQLTRAAIDLAQQRGVTDLYLLTETAGAFFPKFGFSPIDRADVPTQVKESLEFTTLCPDSALVMAASVPAK
ncbi:MAG: GNAT family N-acetyltransferase [Anaerolineales bacterium]|nr:GNAT family N-acetyltransferase [Anaerolineales bacterium]